MSIKESGMYLPLSCFSSAPVQEVNGGVAHKRPVELSQAIGLLKLTLAV